MLFKTNDVASVFVKLSFFEHPCNCTILIVLKHSYFDRILDATGI